jgi:hypothetical protein
MTGDVQLQVDVAVLKTQYDHIVARLDEGKDIMGTINAKFDAVMTEMQEAKQERALAAQRAKWRGAMWAGARHLATLLGAVYLAKKLNVPIDFGM